MAIINIHGKHKNYYYWLLLLLVKKRKKGYKQNNNNLFAKSMEIVLDDGAIFYLNLYHSSIVW